MNESSMTLPIQVTSRRDVGKLLLEVKEVDEFLIQAAIREPGTSVKLPKTSRLLEELVISNKLNLLRSEDRAKLISFLTVVKSKAPQLHISFSADTPPLFTQKITNWLRTNIHPLTLLQIGLQPNIGAGCTLRGNSLYLDLSLRDYFQNQRSLLLNKIYAGMSERKKPSTELQNSTRGDAGTDQGSKVEVTADNKNITISKTEVDAAGDRT